MRNSYTSARTPLSGREISWIIQEKIEAPPPDPVVPTITEEEKVFVEQTSEQITAALRVEPMSDEERASRWRAAAPWIE